MVDKRKVPSSFRKYLKAELGFWQNENIINGEQAGKISKLYQLESISRESANTLLWVIYIIASSLIGIGVISFVAAHWGDISATVKISMLVGSMLACHIVGFYLWQIDGRCKKLGHTLVFLGTLIFGASIGLIAQIFHIRSNPSNGFWAWAIGAIIMGYLLQSTPNVVIAIVTSFIGFVAGMDDIWWGGYKPFEFYPIIAAVAFIPFAYKNKSLLTFVLTLLATSISVIVIATSHKSSLECLLFTVAVIGVVILMFGWGLMSLATRNYKRFGVSAIVIGTVFMLLIVYLLSFLDIARELFNNRNYYSFGDVFDTWIWLVPIAACYVIGIPAYITGMVRIKGRDFVGIFSRVMFVLILLVLCAVLGTIIKENQIIMVATANMALAVCGIVFLIFSFKSELRSLFWLGVLIIAMMIISRSMEYDTGLIIKAIAFFSSGVGLLVGGVLFELFLKKRRLTND